MFKMKWTVLEILQEIQQQVNFPFIKENPFINSSYKKQNQNSLWLQKKINHFKFITKTDLFYRKQGKPFFKNSKYYGAKSNVSSFHNGRNFKI